MDTLLQDLRYAFRSLTRQPAFAATAILTLALGIGATAAIFTVVNAVVIRPLPYREPDRMVAVMTYWLKTGRRSSNLSAPDFYDLRGQSRSFEAFGYWAGDEGSVTVNGHRYQVFVTDLPDADIAYLEALYRGRGRAERQICDTKATGLGNLPSHSFAINHAWLQLVLCAHDLLAWTRLLALDGELATAEPKRLRYCLFHTAARIGRSSRRTTCRLAANWPWTPDLVTAFDRVHRLRQHC